MTTYYVSSTGNNNNDGRTTLTAWKTISWSLDKVIPGDIVEVMDGIYEEQLGLRVGGVAGNPITIRGLINTRPILYGTNISGNTKALYCNGGLPLNYINIDNFIIDGYLNAIQDIYGDYWNISNLEIKNSRDNGAAVYIHNSSFNNLEVHDNAWNGISWGTNGIGSHDNTILNCLIYNNGHNGYDMKDINSYNNIFDNCIGYNNGIFSNAQNVYFTNGSHDNTIQNSTFYNAAAHGVEIQGSKNNKIINVVSYSNISNAFTIAYDPMFGDSSGTILENCTAYGSNEGFHIWSDNCTLINCNAYNNVNGGHVLEGNNGTIIKDISTGNQIIKLTYFNGYSATLSSQTGKVTKINASWLTQPSYSPIGYITELNSNGLHTNSFTVDSYEIYVLPTTININVVVNKYNLLLPFGNIIIDFDIISSLNNSVDITIKDLKSNAYYNINKNGLLHSSIQTDLNGILTFIDNNISSIIRNNFSVEESCPVPICNIIITQS